ncbi:hypothetical protein, partial [Streptobacillus moniliformis]|uniref:hypothetical protein n=1 Tax=Streptobacillus moniliformis TaxID=34105 RepID=UPI001E5695D7
NFYPSIFLIFTLVVIDSISFLFLGFRTDYCFINSLVSRHLLAVFSAETVHPQFFSLIPLFTTNFMIFFSS